MRSLTEYQFKISDIIIIQVGCWLSQIEIILSLSTTNAQNYVLHNAYIYILYNVK